MTDREIFDALPQAERDKLGFEQWRRNIRQSTHSADCWQWGPLHYNCALNEIARLNAESHALQDGWTPEEIADLAARGFIACECKVCGSSAGGQALQVQPKKHVPMFTQGQLNQYGQRCFKEGVSSVHTPDRSDKVVMQQALDALLGYKPHSLTHAKEQGSAIIALREAIAQPVQPSQAQPDTWIVDGEREFPIITSINAKETK